jgi:hypothetical protein
MMLLSLVIENHLAELERLHGADLLPSHRQSLRAMARCRRQGSDLMVLECPDCKETAKIPHSCGRRFRRVRDYDLLHSLAKQLVQLLQLLLRVVLPLAVEPRPRPPVCCPHCRAPMTILAVRVKNQPLLC